MKRFPLSLKDGRRLVIMVYLEDDGNSVNPPGAAISLGPGIWPELITGAQFHVANALQVLVDGLPIDMYENFFTTQSGVSNNTAH